MKQRAPASATSSVDKRGSAGYHDLVLPLRFGVLNPAMNNTKWDELRLAMHAITPPPSWSTLSTNGYRSSADREWFYHFRDGGYESILYVDIKADSPIQRELVRSALKKVHVPGEELPEGFRVFGYLEEGQATTFL